MAGRQWPPPASAVVGRCYSTFLQRAFDHLIPRVGIQKLPVTLRARIRAGISWADGPYSTRVSTHISYLRARPPTSR